MRDVWNHDGAASCCRRADNSFVRWDCELFLDTLAEFHCDAMPKYVVGVVVEQNAENLVVDDSLRQFGGPPENFFDFENGAGFAADFVQ